MRSRTVSDAPAHAAVRSEGKTEELRPATYCETAAAILLALREAGLEHDAPRESPWGCEIELLEEFLDVFAQMPNVPMRKKQ